VTNGSDSRASEAPTRSLGDFSAGPTRTFGDVPAAAPSPGATFTLQPGQRFGAFAIVRPLGSGGMGEVYEAEELESGRHVALKVLSRSLGMSTDHARFIREGRLAAGISHAHTIYIYGTDEIQGVPVIAMELAPGGTFRDVVKARGSLPAAQAVDVIQQVVAGLEAAADAGVLHRDVKPSNCFIDSDGTVKVGDFGLSISTLTTDERSLTLLGTVIGTPAFASPEQLRGDDLDVRSDIYSVGATLYYVLTGRAPFEDTNVIRLVTQVAQELPPLAARDPS
jgi:eukaryotic-like serine/threonine-protein kinase